MSMIAYLKYSAALAAWITSEVLKAGENGRKLLFVNEDEQIFYIQHKGLCAYADRYLHNLIDYRNVHLFDCAGDNLAKKLTCTVDSEIEPTLYITGVTVTRSKLDGRRRVETKYTEFAAKDGNRYYVMTDLLKPLIIYNKCSRYIEMEYILHNNMIYAVSAGETVAVFGAAQFKDGDTK